MTTKEIVKLNYQKLASASYICLSASGPCGICAQGLLRFPGLAIRVTNVLSVAPMRMSGRCEEDNNLG